MSSHLYTPAYATRLGNLTAKSVLVRICDQANDTDGLGYPSVARIAKDTEINPRTVARMVKVFAAMGLVKLFPMEINDRYGRREVDAIQVDLARLGTDMTEAFARCYAEAQGKVAEPAGNGGWYLRDRKGAVSETGEVISETESLVSETEKVISETKPPHPLIGRTIIEPSLEPSLNSRACAPENGAPEELTPEQQEHLDRLAAEGRPESLVELVKLQYAGQNAKSAEARAVRDADAAKDAELAREYPDLETALAKMRKRCGFAWAEGDELGPVLRQVFRDQEELGKPVWRTAAQMIAAWALQRRQGTRLRARYGPMKFFRDGHWLDPQGWHWNTALLELEGGANVGTLNGRD